MITSTMQSLKIEHLSIGAFNSVLKDSPNKWVNSQSRFIYLQYRPVEGLTCTELRNMCRLGSLYLSALPVFSVAALYLSADFRSLVKNFAATQQPSSDSFASA